MKSIAPTIHGWKLRWLMALTHAMTVLGLAPSASKLARMPLEKRASSAPAPWMLLPMPKVNIERTTIPGRDGPIPIKRFRPLTAVQYRYPILFIHGGGWIAGSVDSLDYLCTHLCDRLGAELTAVGYRLAPDHPFPAGLNDCEDALLALASGGSPVVVVGDSAGGNLTAALSLRLRGQPTIARLVIIYPFLDLTMASPSIDPPRQGMSRKDAAPVIELYRASTAIDDPLISPLFAADLTRLPPTLMVTADCDPLRDDGIRYVKRLREAEVPVRHENYAGMPHAFLSLPRYCPAAPACVDVIVEELSA